MTGSLRTQAPSAAAAGGAVELRDLHRRFGPVRAVDGVDLSVAPGEVVALLGPNGAGKSTLVDLLLGGGSLVLAVEASEQDLANAFSDAGVIPGSVAFGDYVDRRFEAGTMAAAQTLPRTS